MLVLIGGLLVVSFLYFVSVMRKDEPTDIPSSSPNAKLEDRKDEQRQTSSPDEGNMECSQSTSQFVCSRCGSRPTTTAIKIEERVVESSCEIIEETSYESSLRYYKDDFRRVPFPEAGVDIVDRKLKNTQESLEREINEEHDDDILTYTESWTENWLFRKRDDNKTTTHDEDAAFKPVSMFVPNTTAKYRAMIGDRDVDEMSDLSDCSNNDDDDESDSGTGKTENGVAKYIYDVRARLLLDGKSKHHREQDETNDHCQSKENTEGIEGSLESNRSYRSELFIESCRDDVNHQNSELLSDNDKLSDIDFNLFSPPKPGTIADREHRKWLTAAPMENNPYSEANLQKRLLEQKYAPKYSSASSLLGRARTNGFDDGAVVDYRLDIDFEAIDLPEISSTPIAESTRIIVEEDKSAEKSNDEVDDVDDAKNKSNGEATIAVTKKNARRRINEVDDCTSEEKISLPSVRELVEVFSAYQRKRGIYVKPTKDKNTSESEEMKFVRVERTQPRPLHLHSLTARSLSKEFREGLR